MVSKWLNSLPEIITVSTGLLATYALYAILLGNVETGVRLIFSCMALDVLDGLLARKLGVSSERGEFLDRLFDRYYQILVPSVLYVYISDFSFKAILYSMLIITISYWRLARRVHTREYFAGLPLYTHTIVIISSTFSGIVVPPYIMILLAILSLVPIKYYRRQTSFSHLENRGTYWQLRLLVPLIFVVLPYNSITYLFTAMEILIFLYILLGWIPFLFGKGSLKEKLFHLRKEKIYD